MFAHRDGQIRPLRRLRSGVKGGSVTVGLAVLLAAPASAGNDGICCQTTDAQRGVVYFYCSGGKTYVVKQDAQTGKLSEKQGAGPWRPYDQRGDHVGNSTTSDHPLFASSLHNWTVEQDKG
jgi:hypothetical protein